MLPMGSSPTHPMLIFPLDYVDRSQLDDLIRAILAKQGVTNEAEVQAVVDAAETDREVRMKILQARLELRRLMEMRARGLSLMQMGFRKWKPVWYPPLKRFSKPVSP